MQWVIIKRRKKKLCKRSQSFLYSNTESTTAKNNPRPRIRQFRQTRPETVLLGLPDLQLFVLRGVLAAVPALLAFLGHFITSDETEKCVVHQRAQQDERVEGVGSIEEDKRKVDERVAQVAS